MCLHSCLLFLLLSSSYNTLTAFFNFSSLFPYSFHNTFLKTHHCLVHSQPTIVYSFLFSFARVTRTHQRVGEFDTQQHTKHRPFCFFLRLSFSTTFRIVFVFWPKISVTFSFSAILFLFFLVPSPRYFPSVTLRKKCITKWFFFCLHY